MPGVVGFFSGWSGLRRFWGLLLVLLAGVIGTLQLIGAPPAPMTGPEPPRSRTEERAPSPQIVHPAPSAMIDRQAGPGRDSPGPINDPDPALLESSGGSAPQVLPRIAPDGRQAMRHYAAGFDRTTTRPRVGILIAGIGLGSADSKRAITDLPAGVSFAVSPYTLNAEVLLGSIRLAGHEYVVSLPMEPLRFPLNDPGPNAMLTTLSVEQNQPRLLWALSRFQGYAGATDIMGAMRGERLADMPDQMTPILAELNRRGLMYVAAPGQPSPVPSAWSRGGRSDDRRSRRCHRDRCPTGGTGDDGARSRHRARPGRGAAARDGGSAGRVDQWSEQSRVGAGAGVGADAPAGG